MYTYTFVIFVVIECMTPPPSEAVTRIFCLNGDNTHFNNYTPITYMKLVENIIYGQPYSFLRQHLETSMNLILDGP